MGVEDLAVYALEAGTEGDERRVMVATEVGLLDHRYAPFGSSARYRLAMLMYPWQVLRGVELRADTFRLWAREHRTRWSFRLHHPHFEAATESPDLGQALCDLARVCAVMAEPFGVPAGRAPSDVPGVIPGGPRPIPPAETPGVGRRGRAGRGRRRPKRASRAEEPTTGQRATDEPPAEERARPTAVPIGDDEEILELTDEERAAVPTRSDDQGLDDQHRVAEAEEPIALAPALRGRPEQPVARLERRCARHPGLDERRHQQQQRAARQMEVRDQRVDRANRYGGVT